MFIGTIFLARIPGINLKQQFTLGKEERLKSKKLTDELFRSGKALTVFPLRVVYCFTEQPQWKFPVQAGVSASGRSFKRSADRNRIKRVLREVYRLQKQDLYEACKNSGRQLAVFFIYIDKTLPEYAFLKEKMGVTLKKLSEKVVENNP